MIQNIKADYETSTGKWGIWLLELLISNGTLLEDEEIEIPLSDDDDIENNKKQVQMSNMESYRDDDAI